MQLTRPDGLMAGFIKEQLLRFSGIYILLLVSLIVHAQTKVENNPPVVEIIKPKPNEKVKWNSLIPYSISVKDVEDGNSAYEEIANLEVILLIKYLEDSSMTIDYLDHIDQDLEPLFAMSKSTCLICHTATSKLIGPSFDLIAKRYKDVENAKTYLVEKVIAGGKGTWGEVQMPTNPDLNEKEAGLLIDWILSLEDNPTQFYVGSTGAIRTQDVQSSPDKSIYILTAAYQDRGISDDPNSKKHGINTIKLKIR